MIDVKLNLKAIPVPLRYQPVYKIIMLLAVLRYGCQRPYSATFLKLHLMLWGLQSEENHTVLLDIKYQRRKSIVPWIFEPALDRVVTLAVINGFCTREIKSGDLNITLQPEGQAFLQKIEDLQLFNEDINKLKAIGIVSQKAVADANKNWELY